MSAGYRERRRPLNKGSVKFRQQELRPMKHPARLLSEIKSCRIGAFPGEKIVSTAELQPLQADVFQLVKA